MDNLIESLLVRNLFSVFDETDPVQREREIGAIYAPDCLFVSPFGQVTGHTALNEAIGAIQTDNPGFRFGQTGAAQAVFECGRMAWSYGPAEDPDRITGLDVIVTKNGRIAALYAFLDTPPADPATI